MAKKFKNRAGSEWRQGSDYYRVRSPYSDRLVGHAPYGSAEDVEFAIAQAADSFKETRQLPSHRRADILAHIAAGISERADELSEMIMLEAGKPMLFARAEVQRAVNTFIIAAEESKRMGGEVIPVDIEARAEGFLCATSRFPRGPMAAVTPFNFPLNLVAHKVAPAIATGTPVILKPAKQTPLTAYLLAEIIEQTAWPRGAFSVIYCADELAEKLVTDPRIKTFSFTGSDRVGWKLKGLAGKKRSLLELGGDAAAIVTADADLDWTASRCAQGAFAYAGQICISIQRLFVEEKIYDSFIQKFVEATQKLPMGDPGDPATVVGPLISDEAAKRIETWVDEARVAGARLHTGGTRNGKMYQPTILDQVPSNIRLSCDEAFGPIVWCEPFNDFDQVLRRVNESRFGLQASVFTKDLQKMFRAWRELEVGGVVVNEFPMMRIDNFPYGGVKDSGEGREGVRSAMEDLTEPRVLLVKTS